MRATRSDDVIFDGVEMPAERAVALAPAGRPAAEALDPVVPGLEQPGHASIYNGVAARPATGWSAT